MYAPDQGANDSRSFPDKDVTPRAHPADLPEEGTTGEQVAEATGGIGGVVAGATIGSLAGPIGTLIGGIAGALGGWWAGRAVADIFEHMTDEDDDFYRMLYDAAPYRLTDMEYEAVRPAYQIGHVAGLNPEYTGREFEEIEPDLRAGWSDELAQQHGSWESVRPLAKDAYSRGRAAYRRPTPPQGQHNPLGDEMRGER